MKLRERAIVESCEEQGGWVVQQLMNNYHGSLLDTEITEDTEKKALNSPSVSSVSNLLPALRITTNLVFHVKHCH
jgi:hypothetical protein